jgi:hypothetical protein
MGPDPGGWGGWFGGLFGDTELSDHRGAHNEKSWKDVQCEPVESVDDACVEREINSSNFGESLGPWIPVVNDCGSFAMNTLEMCHPDGTDWFVQSVNGF